MQNTLIDVANFSPKSLEMPNAWCGHIPFAAWLIKIFKPKLLVELGTHSGNSYFSFCQAVQENELDTHCYAVDTWLGEEHAGFYSEEVFFQVEKYNNKNYASFSTLMRMNFNDAVNHFEHNSIDLLHIDGLHTYNAVKHDFEMWLPKLRPGALVLFHDTNVRARDFGVWKLWSELKEKYANHIEFTHSHGLGVLQIGCSTNKTNLKWLKTDSSDQKILKNYFSALGERQIEKLDLIQTKKNIAERDAQLAERDAQLAERDAQLAERDAQLAERDAHLKSLLASRSWRITAPLRAAGESYRKIRSDLKQIHTLIKTYGVIRLGQKSFETIRKGGLRALGSRLKSCGITDSRNDYTEWIRLYDTLDENARNRIHERIARMERHPLISIVMPVYNPEPRFLIEAVESVQSQLYPYWELCIADDASTDAEVRPVLEQLADQDERIKIVFREENGHIAKASNSALNLATGKFVALLDNDDILSETALFSVALEVLKNSDVAIIYSDEDKIDIDGRRFSPYFKSDFNYDLFMSHNTISHLGVYRRDLVEKIGGFRTDMVGSQDYDLALRVIDLIKHSQISHIPKVLYHWRVHPGSTAQTADAKPYAMLAGERAINAHLKRNKINASAKLLDWGYRVRYDLPVEKPLVSIVIPTKNNYHILRKCIESVVEKTEYDNYEFVIVDNGSSDKETLSYLEFLKGQDNFILIRDDSVFNYSYLNNVGVNASFGKVVCLLNDDIEIIDGEWLSELVSIAVQSRVGVVGARLWYPDNSIQHAGVILGLGAHRVAGHAHYRVPKGNYGYFGRAALMQSFSAVTGACMVFRRSIYEMVGGLDEDLAVAFNDVDFCLRVGKRGYRVVWTPYAELIHHESVSRGGEESSDKKARFESELQKMYQRWGDALLWDPAYNPNLTLDHEDFSLAWPPRKN